ELRAVDAGARDRLLRGRLGEVDGLAAIRDPGARDDAGALPDPLVRGVDGADELLVRHQAVAAGGTHREDARPAAGGKAGDLAHAAAPLSSSATAASRSSGVVTPTEGTPRSPRFARPVS